MPKKPVPDPQRDLLFAAKAELDVTWDALAELSGINPRALKTYRMPHGSQNRRPMPPLAHDAIQRVLAEHRRTSKKRA